jgi:uncharacterized SAM-binding protein YcdF (DUF218 family)
MEALIILALLGIFWLITSRRYRRRILTPLIVLVSSYFILTSPIGVALAGQGLLLGLPPDTGESVDRIVVLGRGEQLRQRRTEIAADLWRAKRAPQIFASGMLDAEFVISQLKDNGIPGSVLRGERCSQSTEENALFTAALLGPQSVKKILLVTDPYHMQRSLQQFRTVGFEVLPYLSPLPPKLTPIEQLTILAREYAGFASYTLSGKLNPRTDTNLQHPLDWVTQRMTDWGCRLQGA